MGRVGAAGRALRARPSGSATARPIVFGDERWCDLTPSHDTPIYLANRENFPIWITHLVLEGKETTAADRDLENEIFSY
jgi:bifunctional DNase/RNase